ncbi:hypothetical protein GCM10009853_057510 [Glycomyces scopariae]
MVWNPVDSRISVTLRICNITHSLSSVKQKQGLRQEIFRGASHATTATPLTCGSAVASPIRAVSDARCGVAGATVPFGGGRRGGA